MLHVYYGLFSIVLKHYLHFEECVNKIKHGILHLDDTYRFLVSIFRVSYLLDPIEN